MPPTKWRPTHSPREGAAWPRRGAPGLQPKPGAVGLPRPVSTSTARSRGRRLRSGGDGAPASVLRAVRRSVSAGAGMVSMAPRRNGRGLWGYAPACCGRLCQGVPSSTLAVRASTSRRAVHRHAARPCLWNFHATPQAHHRNLRQGAFSLVVGVLALPASGRKPVKPSRGDAESATSPFGSGRPVRPWLVVNPGEGTAAPWASWPQPFSENNFPAAARLPRGTNSFRFQVLHGVATAARCGQPIPRRPDHNKDALARPCSTRKEKHHG